VAVPNTVKYFTSADFLHEADLFKTYPNNRGYEQGFGFDRLNVRSNLDFQLTPTTLFKTNLSGSYGVRKSPWGFTGSEYGAWIDAIMQLLTCFCLCTQMALGDIMHQTKLEQKTRQEV
jgi:hypothetical protein